MMSIFAEDHGWQNHTGNGGFELGDKPVSAMLL